MCNEKNETSRRKGRREERKAEKRGFPMPMSMKRFGGRYEYLVPLVICILSKYRIP